MKYRINYHQVIRQANKIDDEAQRINQSIKKLDAFMVSIPSGWESNASRVFLEKCELLKQELKQNRQQLQQVTHQIRSVANRIRQEDERAAAEAEKLKS